MLWHKSFPISIVGCVFFLQEIGGVKFSASGSALGFLPFVVCSGEEGFEGRPSFLLSGKTFPGFAVVNKRPIWYKFGMRFQRLVLSFMGNVDP